MAVHALLFEAKSVQGYLFESGRMRDVIGASELIDSLTRKLLDGALKGAGLLEGSDVAFSRRAGARSTPSSRIARASSGSSPCGPCWCENGDLTKKGLTSM